MLREETNEPYRREDPILGRHNLPVFDTDKHRVTQVLKHYLELGDNFLKFHSAVKGEVMNADAVWEDDYRNWRCTVRRDNVVSVNLYRNQFPQAWWTIEIEVKGARDEITFRYPDTEQGLLESRDMFSILETWHLGL